MLPYLAALNLPMTVALTVTAARRCEFSGTHQVQMWTNYKLLLIWRVHFDNVGLLVQRRCTATLVAELTQEVKGAVLACQEANFLHCYNLWSYFDLPPVQSFSHWCHVDTTLFGIYTYVSSMLCLLWQNLWQVMRRCVLSLSLCLNCQPANSIGTLPATPNGIPGIFWPFYGTSPVFCPHEVAH